jgi:CheY-like chemotaxis protein
MHAKEKESYSAKGDQHLLLVEDTPFFQTLEKSYLESAGYQVTCVDGVDALKSSTEKIRSGRCDIEMPRMNVYELVRQLRSTQQWRKLPVVAVTALADQDPEKSERRGFTITRLNRQGSPAGEVVQTPERGGLKMSEMQFSTFYLDNARFGVDIILVRESTGSCKSLRAQTERVRPRSDQSARQIVTVLDLGIKLASERGRSPSIPAASS